MSDVHDKLCIHLYRDHCGFLSTMYLDDVCVSSSVSLSVCGIYDVSDRWYWIEFIGESNQCFVVFYFYDKDGKPWAYPHTFRTPGTLFIVDLWEGVDVLHGYCLDRADCDTGVTWDLLDAFDDGNTFL